MHDQVSYDYLWIFIISAGFLLIGLLLITPKLLNYLDKLADKTYQASNYTPLRDRAGKAKKDE